MLAKFICPTDSRLRPDQRALENGNYDLAEVEKTRLEEQQRKAAAERAEHHENWSPRWFSVAFGEMSGNQYWRYNGDYWKTRDDAARGIANWSAPEIF